MIRAGSSTLLDLADAIARIQPAPRRPGLPPGEHREAPLVDRPADQLVPAGELVRRGQAMAGLGAAGGSASSTSRLRLRSSATETSSTRCSRSGPAGVSTPSRLVNGEPAQGLEARGEPPALGARLHYHHAVRQPRSANSGSAARPARRPRAPRSARRARSSHPRPGAARGRTPRFPSPGRPARPRPPGRSRARKPQRRVELGIPRSVLQPGDRTTRGSARGCGRSRPSDPRRAGSRATPRCRRPPPRSAARRSRPCRYAPSPGTSR